MDAAYRLERALRQARTPRKRRGALSTAEHAAGEMLAAGVGGERMAEVVAMVRNCQSGILNFPDWREHLASTAGQVRDEVDHETVFLLTA